MKNYNLRIQYDTVELFRTISADLDYYYDITLPTNLTELGFDIMYEIRRELKIKI